MKYSAALVSLALATSVAAQGLGDLPECARDCATQYLRGGIGNCGSDPECICKNSAFLDSIACCLVGVCSEADQKKAVSIAATLCKAFGVNDLPTAVVCGTVSPSTAAPVKTSTPAATGGANTSTPVTAPASTATNATDAPSTTETEAETPEESSATKTDANAQGASTTSTSTSTSTNFGPRPTVAAGLGAIGGLAAAFALL